MFSRFPSVVVRCCARQTLRRTIRTFCTDAGEPITPTISGKSYPVLTGERGINHVTLVGRLGRDPEVRGSEDNPVTIFPLATSQTYKTPDGEYKQVTDWHRIIVFRAMLGQIVASRIAKGDKVYVSGKINYSRYPDKETNKLHTVAQIRADDVVLLSKRAGSPDLDEPPPLHTED